MLVHILYSFCSIMAWEHILLVFFWDNWLRVGYPCTLVTVTVSLYWRERKTALMSNICVMLNCFPIHQECSPRVCGCSADLHPLQFIVTYFRPDNTVNSRELSCVLNVKIIIYVHKTMIQFTVHWWVPGAGATAYTALNQQIASAEDVIPSRSNISYTLSV